MFFNLFICIGSTFNFDRIEFEYIASPNSEHINYVKCVFTINIIFWAYQIYWKNIWIIFGIFNWFRVFSLCFLRRLSLKMYRIIIYSCQFGQLWFWAPSIIFLNSDQATQRTTSQMWKYPEQNTEMKRDYARAEIHLTPCDDVCSRSCTPAAPPTYVTVNIAPVRQCQCSPPSARGIVTASGNSPSINMRARHATTEHTTMFNSWLRCGPREAGCVCVT